MSPTRRLAAIADVVGYSHLIEANEAGTLRKRCKPSSEDGPSHRFAAPRNLVAIGA
jgi:hypothetical protein